MFYVRDGDVLNNPLANSTYTIQAWDLDQLFHSQISNPTVTFTKTWEGMNISRTLITKADYDSTRNVIWIAYTNYTKIEQQQNLTGQELPEIYFTKFSLSDYSWSESLLFNQTISIYAISTASFLRFHTNGLIEFNVLFQTTLYQVLCNESTNFAESNWSLPKYLSGIYQADAVYTHLIIENSRTLLIYYSDRDVWIENYYLNWTRASNPIRITVDYIKSYALTLFNNGTGYELILSQFSSIPTQSIFSNNSDLQNWTKIGDFPRF
jgi:hypothetical protein